MDNQEQERVKLYAGAIERAAQTHTSSGGGSYMTSLYSEGRQIILTATWNRAEPKVTLVTLEGAPMQTNTLLALGNELRRRGVGSIHFTTQRLVGESLVSTLLLALN